MKNEKLKNARKGRGFTQQQLATKVGVALITLRRWEYGSLSPSEDNRARLCQILGKVEAEIGLADLPNDPTPVTPSLSERSVQGDDNRKTMMKRVDTLWVSGVLDHSLARGTLIHLHVREQPDAVLNPWAQSVQEAKLPPEPLDQGTTIIQVYDETNGTFLLLGEPGAGKTTLLLSLTRDLLSRAKANETHPIPVVFNLSSWAQQRQSIEAWMIEELGSKYQVPHKLAEEWIAASLILPLLDGLDEVAQIHRKECVETINAYRREHGFLPMVVCCRTSEYLALGTHIALNKAIAIEPLTLQQIEQYIGKEGKRLNSVKTALSSDQSLREMVSTPLMLTVIISQAFQNTPLDTLLSIDDPAERRRLIFKKYVEVVLNRRGQESRYSPEQMQHWLAWLAGQLEKQNQGEFYLIQAGELDLAVKYGLVVGGSCIIYAFSDTMDLIRRLGARIEPAEMMKWSWQSVRNSLLENTYKGALVTLFVYTTTVVVFACVSSLSYGPAYGIRYGLIYGVIVGLITGVTTLLTQVLTSGWSSSILPKEQQIRSNEGIIRSARNSLAAALVSGPLGGIVSAIVIALAFKFVAGLSGFAILGAGFGLILGTEFALQILMAYGGIPIIEHYVLRWYLWRAGQMPLNYTTFLDHATERILLRKIGGGYMFSHRLLLDYFVSLNHTKRGND